MIVRLDGTQLIVHHDASTAASIYRRYRIASMSKMMTSVTALTLVEEGTIDLKDDVAKYIPSFANLKVLRKGKADQDGIVRTLKPAPLKQPMTVQNLFTHTSGLTYGFLGDCPEVADEMKAKNVEFNPELTGSPWEDEPNSAVVDRLATIPLVCQPGTAWHYSVSIDVLGNLVERVAGKNLMQVMQERLFEPLGMADTCFQVPAEKAGRLSACYAIAAASGPFAATPQPGEEGQPYLLKDGRWSTVYLPTRMYLSTLMACDRSPPLSPPPRALHALC